MGETHHYPDDLTCPDTLSALTIISLVLTAASDVCITSPGLIITSGRACADVTIGVP